MSKLEELIQELCPNGVEFVPLWSITAWDKKFNAVDKAMQPKVYKYPVLLAKDLFAMQQEKGDVFLLSTGTETGWTTEKIAGDYLCKGEVVTLPWGKSSPVKGLIKYYNGKFVTGDNRIATSLDTEKLLNKYLYYWMVNQGDVIDTFYRGSGIKHPSMFHVLTMTIPVPPMEVQREIVRLLDDFTAKTAELQAELNKEYEARKKQYECYRDSLLNGELDKLIQPFCPDEIEYKFFGDCAKIIRGASPRPIKNFITAESDGVNWIKIGDVKPGEKYITASAEKITLEGAKKSRPVKKGDFILSNSMSFGRPYILKIDGCVHDGWLVISEFSESYTSDFLYYLLSSNMCQNQMKKKASFGGAVQNLKADTVRELFLPVPPLKAQQKIVHFLNELSMKIAKIQDELLEELESRQKQYEYYRDKLLTFKELNESEVN